jgi:hypothetical protein
MRGVGLRCDAHTRSCENDRHDDGDYRFATDLEFAPMLRALAGADGAGRADILSIVLLEVVFLVALGSAIGLASAFATLRLGDGLAFRCRFLGRSRNAGCRFADDLGRCFCGLPAGSPRNARRSNGRPETRINQQSSQVNDADIFYHR